MKKVWIAVLLLSLTLTACGKKAAEEPKEQTDTVETEEKEETKESKEPEFSFLERLGQDCQMLPDAVEVTNNDRFFTATSTIAEQIGGVDGYVSYQYESEKPFITKITWNVVGCEVDQALAIQNAMKERYGEPALEQENTLEEGTGRSGLLVWKSDTDGDVRASVDENPTNGANVTILWMARQEDDLSFIDYIGTAISEIPEETAISMTEGDSGLMIMMNENYVEGICGSASLYYTQGEDVINAVSWESQEMSGQELEEMLAALQMRYGEYESGANGAITTCSWANADGMHLTLSDMEDGDVHYISLKWE